ncbi:MAG: prepilin-type N-terminal cleavage/methylation domain-containing protein [Elusimicrobia bacterium]|nr:prepilin-type N-terminal cleavage/methylation domain-containing protein [Elusimicrobiota bacterium]
MKKIKGFTLVELIITMTIVVILSLVSWPIYRSYHLKEVSMLGEGYALLGAIKDAQIHYYNEYGNFLTSRDSTGVAQHMNERSFTSADPVLGINVMNNRYFSMFNFDTAPASEEKWKYSFVARVFGKISNNNVVSMILPFNLTQRGELTIIGNGTTTLGGWGR